MEAISASLALEWKAPLEPIFIDLGGDFHLYLAACAIIDAELEGFLCPTVVKERWVLEYEETKLEHWDVLNHDDPMDIWNRAEPLLDTYADDVPEKLLRFRMAFPDTREDAVYAMAEKIYREGRALDYICDSCGKIHVGDRIAIRAMILSYAATRVSNGEGIHISLSGPAGTGKSHAAKTAAKHLPQKSVSDARLSDKALVYHKFEEGTVLLLDDQELSEDFQELLKVASTSWTTPAKYITVKNQASLELEIPPRCPFWVIKANMTGDEQVHDRQLVMWTDDSLEQLQSIQQAILQSAMNPDAVAPEDEIDISRAIWRHIPRETVVIPFADDIEVDEHMDPRNIKLFKSLVEAIALMDASNRKRNSKGYIEATEDDFICATKIMNPLLGNTGGSQKLKLSSAAAKVLDYLRQEESGDIQFSDLRHALTMSQAVLSQALYGRTDRSTEGLVSLCPAVEIVDVSVSASGKGGGAINKRVKAVAWSRETYNKWLASSGLFVLRSKANSGRTQP